MQNIKIWHNPRCTKSREAVKEVEASDCEVTIIKYLEDLPSVATLKETLHMLQLAPRELMRTTEDIYKELNLKNEMNDEKLIEAMVAHPKLIQRPILFKNDKAIIGRPSSVIEDFLKA
ncbi:arsenate reductase (glutaredoxin) [Sulfurimonas sp. SAG-AH-194-I05]|nr:arsenate reductase (glutaredoxin) [Sulfurimonas sp. SAG-AH-194-I05]MDF1874243.1 arsenate reductase (glutaredoxin) [Sulfurimonas sp. SAG-AH-194-I05]